MKPIGISLLLTIWIASASFAADVTQPSSVFERPSFASKQLEILRAKATVTVTGMETHNEEGKWVPVSTSTNSGWMRRESVELESRDMGYVTWPGKEQTWWIRGSLGAALMSSTDFYTGERLDFGMEWFVNPMRQFFIGFNVSSPITGEKFTSQFDGKVQRYNTYFNFGYLLLPPNLYVRYGIGLSPLAGGNRHFMNKFGASVAAELGYDLIVRERTRLGLSFSYEYTGKSRQSVNFIQDLGHCLLGGCDPSTPMPSASIFALNLNFSFAP